MTGQYCTVDEGGGCLTIVSSLVLMALRSICADWCKKRIASRIPGSPSTEPIRFVAMARVTRVKHTASPGSNRYKFQLHPAE